MSIHLMDIWLQANVKREVEKVKNGNLENMMKRSGKEKDDWVAQYPQA